MARPTATATASILMEPQPTARLPQRPQPFTVPPELREQHVLVSRPQSTPGHVQEHSRQEVMRYRAADQPPLGRVELAPLEPIYRYVQRAREGVTEQPSSRVPLDSFPTQRRMPEKGTTESVTGQLGQTPYRVLSDSFPPQRWMPDERTSEYVSDRPSNLALSILSPTQRQMSEERTPPAIMEREPVPTVYHTARMQRENACCLEDPLPYPKPRPKERKTLQFANGNSEDDDDVSDTPPRPTPKAKSNGYVERSPHSIRRHHGTSKRAADARDGQSQHSPAKSPIVRPVPDAPRLPIPPGERKNVHELLEAHHVVLRPTQNVKAEKALVGGKIQTRQVLQIAVRLNTTMTFMTDPNTP